MLAGLSPGLVPERQFARRLAENGCEVLVPVLIDRQDTWSGMRASSVSPINHIANGFTARHMRWAGTSSVTKPKRFGRRLIGSKQKRLLQARANTEPEWHNRLRRGWLLALYSAALDTRIEAAVSAATLNHESEYGRSDLPECLRTSKRIWRCGNCHPDCSAQTDCRTWSGAKIDGPPKPREGRGGAAPASCRRRSMRQSKVNSNVPEHCSRRATRGYLIGDRPVRAWTRRHAFSPVRS